MEWVPAGIGDTYIIMLNLCMHTLVSVACHFLGGRTDLKKFIVLIYETHSPLVGKKGKRRSILWVEEVEGRGGHADALGLHTGEWGVQPAQVEGAGRVG